jgi:hypothetical protein
MSPLDSEANRSEDGPFKDDTKRLRKLADSMTEKPADEVSIKNAAEILKLAAEIDNHRLQTHRLDVEGADERRRRLKFENSKEYITLLTPLAATVVLALTLILQAAQTFFTETDKRHEAEDARWDNDIKELVHYEHISPAGILLKSFANSTRYGDESYKTANQILSSTSSMDDPNSFNKLFDLVFQNGDWNTLPSLVDLSRQLYRQLQPLNQKALDGGSPSSDINTLAEPDRARGNNLRAELKRVTEEVSLILATKRPRGARLDLHDAYFIDGDFKHADLSGANLTGTSLISMDLEGTDLSGITEYRGAQLWYSTWWRASRRTDAFFECLMTSFTFDARYPNYYQGKTKPTAEEYKKATEDLGLRPASCPGHE